MFEPLVEASSETTPAPLMLKSKVMVAEADPGVTKSVEPLPVLAKLTTTSVAVGAGGTKSKVKPLSLKPTLFEVESVATVKVPLMLWAEVSTVPLAPERV